MHSHAAPRKRERDPARPDPELERPPVARELRKQVDHRVDDRRGEHLGRGLVVARGDALAEVAVLVHQSGI